MSAFDLETFLSSTTDAPLSTRLPTIPAKDYLAVISSHDKWCRIRVLTEGEFAGRPIAEIYFDILDEEAKAVSGMDTVRVRREYWLDLNANNKIDWSNGKNVQLGQLREAVGQNKPGIPFAQLRGAGPLRVTVIQEPDKKDASIIYNRVTKTVSATTATAAAA